MTHSDIGIILDHLFHNHIVYNNGLNSEVNSLRDFLKDNQQKQDNKKDKGNRERLNHI